MSSPSKKKETNSIEAIHKNESENDKNNEDKVNLDEVISEAIGESGKYQVIGLLMFMVYMVVLAPFNTEYAFTTARINTRCLIRDCDKNDPEFTPPWILNAVPSSGSTFDDCTRYELTGSPTNASDVCPAFMFDNSTVVKCSEWIYENDNTIVSEFDLGCDEWSRSFVGSVRVMGCFVNLVFTGYVSDRFGRKPALLFNTINVLWIGILRSLSTTYWMFVLLEFAETCFGFSGFTCFFLILLELFGSKYRLIIGASSSTSYSLGQIYLALLAWQIPYWRYLTLAIYIQQIIPLILALLVSESFRWLMVKEKYEEGVKLLVKVAKVNGRTVTVKTLNNLRGQIFNEIGGKDNQKHVRQPWLPLLVWRHKTVLRRCMIASMLYITVTLTTFGISLHVVNLTGNQFLNYAATGLAEIPGHWTAYFMMTHYGRKFLLMIAYWACGVCMIASVWIGSENLYYPWLPLTLSLLGKYCIALVGASIFVYTAEIFPTSHRHTLLAFCSMIGRIGSVIAPLTPALGAMVWSELPCMIFAVCCFVSGTLMTIMPETRGVPMPDTMDQI